MEYSSLNLFSDKKFSLQNPSLKYIFSVLRSCIYSTNLTYARGSQNALNAFGQACSASS